MESGNSSNPVSKHHLLLALAHLLPHIDREDVKLLGSEEIMKKLADLSAKNVSSKAVSKAISTLYLSVNDEEVVVSYIGVLINFLNERDYDE